MYRPAVLWAAAATLVATLGTGCAENGLIEPATTGAPQKSITVTEQSAMIQLTGQGTYTIEGTEVWKFSKTAAAAYFTGGTANQREQVAMSQRCTFYDGGTLVSQTLGGGPNAVTIYPTQSSVSAHTAWTLESSTTGDGEVEVSIAGLIVGESWMANRTFPIGAGGIGTGGKYSFSLRNPDGTSRVENLSYTVVDASNTVVASGSITATQGHEDNLLYTRTAGSTWLANGYVADILAGDTHANNNSDGADTETFTLPLTLGAGSYSVSVSATVKGVDGTSSFTVSVVGDLEIDAQGCE